MSGMVSLYLPYYVFIDMLLVEILRIKILLIVKMFLTVDRVNDR